MPTFREDTKIGGMVPMMKTDDINDQAITKDKIRDGNITSEKLADGAVSTDKLPDGAIKTPKIADGNITTSKLAEASVVTSKIADQNVTKEKIADQSVDNSKLSHEAVTYDKLKDKSVITEKLNDRAVTTEKVEEKAITNAKIGDSAVDGRVISEASVEKKHLANDSVATEKLQDSAITSDKIHIHAVTEEKIEDSAISNSKLADNSVGTSKIKDGNVTNEKVANNTITIDKFDPELRKAIQAATGLPENLVEVIQDVDVEVKSLHSKDEDLQSQIADKQQQITANDKDIESLQNRSTQMEQSINNIAVTGGASVANTVAYSNTASGLVSINAQGAIDELAAKNATKAEKAEVTAELEKKFDKKSILQESGDANDKVMSQKATTTAIADETTRAKAAEEAIIYDVSAHNNGAVFESLKALLSSSNLSTLIPTSVRHGGMSIRFIQGSAPSSNNKYVQFRCMAQNFTTDVSQWQGPDDFPIIEDDNNYREFSISDLEGNEIVSFNGGHIRTKNFDSRLILNEDETANVENSIEDSFSIQDKQGNTVLEVKNGIAKTKIPSPYCLDEMTTVGFSVCDEQGNVVLEVKSGQIKTREFDSSVLPKLENLVKQLILESNSRKLVRDVPMNRGVLNAYKKCQQLVNLKWTALSSVHDMNETPSTVYPRKMNSIPYSEVINVDKFVGLNVSIDTFMTAAHNPYSLLYTEDLRKPNPTSDYGITYHNYDGVTYIGPYYGDVCNTFVLWCLGIKADFYSYVMKYLSEIGFFEKVYDNTAQGVELMDVLWEPGHCSLVSDIYRNKRGEVERIYLSEHSGIIHTTIYTAASFQNRMNKKGGILYRYKYLYTNLDYMPSVFSPVEGENLPAPVYNDDICVFAGNKSSFVVGDIIYLNYIKNNYTQVQIYKESTGQDILIDTLQLDNSSSVHRLDITSLNLTYGKYKARLTNGINNSDYTYFEIIDTNTSYEKVDTDHKFYFSSSNGTPEWLSVCLINGRHKAVVQFTDEDRENGFVKFNVKDLSEAERLTGPESVDHASIDNMSLYFKVYFKGNYSTIPSDLISITL